MKTKQTVVLAVVASFALGAVAVQTLHAQAKPVAYVVVENAVTSQDGYTKEFLPPVAKAIQDAGGKFLARGGKIVSFEGAPPANRVVVIQFENIDKAEAWFNSSPNKDALAIGRKFATLRVFAIEGVAQ
jgi:uncharacterized protein (DUF1330 family)